MTPEEPVQENRIMEPEEPVQENRTMEPAEPDLQTLPGSGQICRAGDRLRYCIAETDRGMDVGKILRERLHMTGHQIRRLKFRRDGILCDGQRVRVVYQPACGSILDVAVADAEPVMTEHDRHPEHKQEHMRAHVQEYTQNYMQKQTAQKWRPLQILYEDEDILAVNKPAGCAVHRGRGHYGDTLADAAEDYLRQEGRTAPAVHIIGRLDRDTSGIVIIAKNAVAAQRLSDQKRTEHSKKYLALVEGIPQDGQREEVLIDLPVRKQAGTLNRMEAATDKVMQEAEGEPSGGRWQQALTRYRVLASIDMGRESVSLVEAVPVTGRTHQIRVHMAAMGHPLIGDPVYGRDAVIQWERAEKNGNTKNRETKNREIKNRETENRERESGKTAAGTGVQTDCAMYLHCAEAVFTHPFTGESIKLRASRR